VLHNENRISWLHLLGSHILYKTACPHSIMV
jgi:hypothetical protein